MASDMISRKALVKAILAERDKISLEVVPRYGFGVPVPDPHGQAMRGGIRKALHCVETAQAVDAVEVVRCKECIFYQPYIQEMYEGKGDCEEHDAMVYDDDFCSYGTKG